MRNRVYQITLGLRILHLNIVHKHDLNFCCVMWNQHCCPNSMYEMILKFTEHKRTEQAYSSDEDAGIDMTIDNCSEISGQSDLKSNHEDAGMYISLCTVYAIVN